MISITPINRERNQFIIRSDEPIRVEVMTQQGETTVFGYRGTEDVPDQEPLFFFNARDPEDPGQTFPR